MPVRLPVGADPRRHETDEPSSDLVHPRSLSFAGSNIACPSWTVAG